MLTLQNLTVVYPDGTKAVDDLSLSLGAGETVALIGENGAGKTSLLLSIVGILEPVAGIVEVNGIRLGKKTVNELRKQAGLVFQNPDDQLFMPLIYDDVAFGCRSYGLSEEQVETRVTETLDLLGIGHLRGRSSLKLSGGEKRMAAIATVLAMEPSVLLFDEPTAFLDPKAKRVLAETLTKLQHTKIIATHDMTFAVEVCDRVILLQNGRIAADGTTALLQDKKLLQDLGLE